MYLEFYGLREKPFTRTPDPRFLYLGESHREALARLQYAVEERELALLTGEIGCGKTTLSRALMDSFDDSYRFCFILNPKLTGDELLRMLARTLGADGDISSKDELLRVISESLYRHHERGVVPVVVVDEAQLIGDREVFDEIRLLTNFQLDDRNLLSIIIMGQPELRKKLANRVYEPLRQRIAIHYHLRPLELEEVQEYLDFRLETAGGPAGLFTPDAVLRIFELSDGVPRKINLVATNALLAGFGSDASIIDAEIVDQQKHESL